MCVIFVSYRQVPEYPLILLANRDEFYDRPTAKADYWEDFPSVFGGRDKVGGGTWLGVTKSGKFAAVTNYRDPNQKKGSISRGKLVADFLSEDVSANEYLKTVRKNSTKYTGFNLLLGEISVDKNELFYFSNQENEISRLKEGLYGLSNHLLDTPWRKVKQGKKKLAELVANNHIKKEKLFDILNDKKLAQDDELPETGIGHEREKLLSSIFIETPIYGTRCSTVLTFDEKHKYEFEERVFI